MSSRARPRPSARPRRAASRVVGLLAGALLAGDRPLAPAVIVVQGDCTLVDAIGAANTDSAIGGCTAGAGADELVLTADVLLSEVADTTLGATGTPAVTTAVTIHGAGFVVARNPAAEPFRLLLVADDGELTLDALTLTGGSSPSAEGGAILNAFGSLALMSATVGASSTGLSGGGIANFGSLTVRDSLLAGNTAGSYGGGIAHLDGVMNLTSSTLSGNNAYAGGGLYNYASAVLESATVAGNGAHRGAGIWNGFYGALTIAASTLAANTAGDAGAGVYNLDFYDSGNALAITNSTFSANSAGRLGGGLRNASGEATLRHVTFAGNSAVTGAAVYHASPHGAGVVSVGGSVAALTGGGEHCAVAPGDVIVDAGGNLDDDGTCPVIGVVTGLDPALADNGGPTATHALLAGSSAIDANGDCGLATDQRGFARDAACDGGAFEFAAAIFTDGFESGDTTAWSASVE